MSKRFTIEKIKKTQYEDLIIKIYFNANETCKHEKKKVIKFCQERHLSERKKCSFFT